MKTDRPKEQSHPVITMEGKQLARAKDPERPKNNPRLRYIDQLMRYSWSAWRETKEYKKKREYLTGLKPLIDQWLAEPELIHDLENGKSPAAAQKRWSETPFENVEFPFDRGGETTDRYFYFSYRSSSELFTGAQRELDEVKYCPFRHCVYVVTIFEKIYATGNETAMHFFSETAFGRHAKRSSADKKHDPGRCFILADPAGSREGHTYIACSNQSPSQARKRADELAEKFNIRFLVARVVGCVDTH